MNSSSSTDVPQELDREFTEETWSWISDLCVEEYAYALSDCGLTSSSAFMTHDLSTIEDIPPWLLKAMQKRKNNLLVGQGQCSICFDHLPAHAGVRCNGTASHFLCQDCLAGHVAMESSAEKLDLLAKNGGVLCPVPDCSVRYTEQQLAQILPKDVYAGYVGAQHKVAEQRIEEAAKKGAEKDIADAKKEIEDLEKLLAAAQTGKEVDLAKRVGKLRIKVIEEVLTLRCPRCNQAFIDFTGCQALTCSKAKCGCAFCAYCLKDCGTDAHEHAFQVCAPKWGDDADVSVKKAQTALRTSKLKQFFSELESGEVKRRLLEALDKDLVDLKIDPKKLSGSLGLKPGKGGGHEKGGTDGKGGKAKAYDSCVVEIRDANPHADNVRLRDDARQHCPVGTRLPNGTLVLVLDEWAQIRVPKLGEGYVKWKHIVPEAGGQIKAGGYGVIKDADANFDDVRLRQKANSKMFPSPKRRIPNGAKVEILDIWSHVRCQPPQEHVSGFVKSHHCRVVCEKGAKGGKDGNNTKGGGKDGNNTKGGGKDGNNTKGGGVDGNTTKGGGKGKHGALVGKGQVIAQQADGYNGVAMRRDPNGPVIHGLDCSNGEVLTVVQYVGDMVAVIWPEPNEISWVKARNVKPFTQEVFGPQPALFVLKQADGFGTVTVRMEKNGTKTIDVPNGTQVECLAIEGEWMRVSIPAAGLKEAFIKSRNAIDPP